MLSGKLARGQRTHGDALAGNGVQTLQDTDLPHQRNRALLYERDELGGAALVLMNDGRQSLRRSLRGHGMLAAQIALQR